MRDGETAASDTPALEWAVGGLGALMFLAMIGVLVWDQATGAGGPPDLHARVARTIEREHGRVVELSVLNDGGSAAKAVRVVVELRGPEGAVERREAIFDYVAPRSRAMGGVVFAPDSAPGELEIRVEGYAYP